MQGHKTTRNVQSGLAGFQAILISVGLVVGVVPIVSIILLFAVHLPLAVGAHHRLNSSTRQAKEISSKKDEFSCAVWAQSHLDRKFVEAGIMRGTEVAICDDPTCENCWNVRSALRQEARNKLLSEKQKFAELQAKDKRYDGYRFGEAELIERRKKSFVRIDELPGGLRIPRPDVVPGFASVELCYERKGMNYRVMVVWKWSYPDSPKNHSYVLNLDAAPW